MGIAVENALKDLDIRTHLDGIFNEFGDTIGTYSFCRTQSIYVERSIISMQGQSQINIGLPAAEGASWNPTLICSPRTRVALLEDISRWAINTAANAERIFWLCDV